MLDDLVDKRHKFRLKAPDHFSFAFFWQLKEQIDQPVRLNAVFVAEVPCLLTCRLVNNVFISHKRSDLSNHLLVNFGQPTPMTGDILVVL